MPPPTLDASFAGGDKNYVPRFNNNFTLIQSALDDLYQQVLAGMGEGAILTLDAFDRVGIVGAASYRLDLDGYPGGALITIGRRPAFQAALGDKNISAAWINAGGLMRVQLSGDTQLNAAPITAGLPKTIYIGIPSTGVPQFYEDTATPSVLYVYCMSWNGFQLANFKRMAPLLPAYTTLQEIAAAPRIIQIFDSETDFAGDVQGGTSIPLPGARDDNGIDVDGSMKVLGFVASFAKNGPDGMYAPSGPDNRIRFRVICDGIPWTESDFEFDCSMVADEVFKRVAGGVGDEKFVTTVKRFSLERTYKGAHVVSARAFTWGLLVAPLLGAPVPKDESLVMEI